MPNNEKKHVRIWTAVKDAQAGIMVTEKKALVIADRNNYFAATPNGSVITGKSIVFNTMSENVRDGGMWTRYNDLVQMIPTTLVTPMPAHIPFPPLGFAMGILDDLPFFLAMAAGVIV